MLVSYPVALPLTLSRLLLTDRERSCHGRTLFTLQRID